MKLLTLLLLLNLNLVSCQEKIELDKSQSLPQLEGYINDFDNLFRDTQETILNASVGSFYKTSGIGITVVTVIDIKPYENIFEYSLDLAKHANRGKVVIVVCKNLCVVHIQNSDDILNKLTNEETQNIIDQYISPEFKKADYFRGLLKGIAEIKKELN